MSLRAVNQGRYTLMANKIAQQELEYLKQLSWDKLENFNTLVATNPEYYYRDTNISSTLNGSATSVKYESRPIIYSFSTDASGTNVVRIVVVVKYNFGSIEVKNTGDYYKSVVLESLVARP
jgi:hypothetical protein